MREAHELPIWFHSVACTTIVDDSGDGALGVHVKSLCSKAVRKSTRRETPPVTGSKTYSPLRSPVKISQLSICKNRQSKNYAA